MVEPTRLDIINKLESLGDITQEEMLTEMTIYATEHSSNPKKLLDDLMSYPLYANATN